MSKKKKKFIKALKEWDVSEPIYLADLLAKDKESKKELNAAKMADKLIEKHRPISDITKIFEDSFIIESDKCTAEIKYGSGMKEAINEHIKNHFNKEPMKRKLSDLQENEYVFCKTEEEAKRVFNKGRGDWFYDQYGTSINPIAIAHKGSFMSHPSTDFADYEAPVPKKPKRDIIINANSRNGEYIKALEAYTDHLEQIIKDKDKYIAHMEKEGEKGKFVQFKTKCLVNYIHNFTMNKEYVVFFEIENNYIVYSDIGVITVVYSGVFKKCISPTELLK